MKKALVVCSLALLSFIPASAQFSWGLRGGLNLVNNDITSVSKETALVLHYRVIGKIHTLL